MKKLILCFLCAVTLAFAPAALYGCGEVDGGGFSPSVIITADAEGRCESVVFTIEEGAMNITASTSLTDYLAALESSGKITVVYEKGAYGSFICEVCGVANKATATGGFSWLIYTDLTVLDGVTYSYEEYGTYDAGGKTLYSAAYGSDGMPAVVGTTYALVYSQWNM